MTSKTLTPKKPVTPFFTRNEFAHAKVDRLIGASVETPPQNEKEEKQQAERKAAIAALARSDMSLYSTMLHGH